MHLISTDLPAPLSPASAVTCPAGNVEADIGQRLHRTEMLADAPQPQQRRRRGRAPAVAPVPMAGWQMSSLLLDGVAAGRIRGPAPAQERARRLANVS